ncbi:MAG TPA: amino acid adenylation domain-containing protein, partial [Candidatus Udaeobacter sp.]|nr:amino acid adenylation domain-containing protein [Candidatus Udaeobacter sp.]
MGYLLWHDLAEQAARGPARPAVVDRETVLTYGELDRASTQLALFLLQHGIGRGDRVGIWMPKSHRSVVAMLGILKAGAAYVPVDPHAPPARAAYILGDCAVRALVTSPEKLAELSPELAQLTALEIILGAGTSTGPARAYDWSALDGMRDGALPVDSIESDPAYLLYTSGSTGHPKGVILSHRHAITFVEWGVATFGVTDEDRLSNHAPLHFDLSVFDIYVALRAGARVVIVPEATALFPIELARWIARQEITIWYSVPSALTRLVMHGKLSTLEFPRLHTVLFAGEVFPVKYLRAVMACFRGAAFYNLYGPTETNVCTYYPVPRDLPAEAPGIPIGVACANTDVFAVDAAGKAVPVGEEGELYVRGPALLSGYWGKPEKTRETLVQNPLQPAYPEWVYRTGDIVKMDAQGQYWFVGRRDHMIKSRGYRIELGEVEAVLYQHAAVKEAVVLAIPDEEIGNRLEAVIVLNGPGTSAADLVA